MAVIDVDGTLTRSDVRGYVETVFLGMYDYVHPGVARFLNSMVSGALSCPLPVCLSACLLFEGMTSTCL